MPPTHSNTSVSYAGFQKAIDAPARRIITDVQVVSAHYSGESYTQYNGILRGLWDTGASSTTICTQLADKLGLPCIGEEEMTGAGGKYPAKKYLAGLILPNNVTIPYLILYSFAGANDFDMLIGMDIITRGDFLISSTENRVYFSFQHPSFGGFYLRDIQHVQLHNHTPLRSIGRNAPCPCESGKKYKKRRGE